MWYPNTSYIGLDNATGNELWRWVDVTPTLLPAPNGSIVRVNVTRNYTYYLAPAPAAAPDAPRALRRYEWTQGFPFGPPASRFCAVFDYAQDYAAGPPDVASFGPPPGVRCGPGLQP